jgi:tRNA (guanine-N7-)-methyltransferase
MAKYKIRQFAELETFPNVIHQVQRGEFVPDHQIKGNWRRDFFKREGKLILELGCGKGEYTLALASAFPDQLFVGVDLKGNRLWRGALTAREQNLQHAGFLRCKIENLNSVFAPSEIDGIWITFPDPQPGLKREKKRLTGKAFLDRYRAILSPGSEIHLKTDSLEFYLFSLEMASAYGSVLLHSNDLYHEPEGFLGVAHPLLTQVKTYYERKFLAMGKPICYLRFTL